jgi:hypothetical protein
LNRLATVVATLWIGALFAFFIISSMGSSQRVDRNRFCEETL